jgi:carbonic anhydrase
LLDTLSQQQSDELINDVAKKNVHRTSQMIIDKSAVIRTAVESETVMVVGALYDVTTGNIEFFEGGIDA